MFTFLLLLTHGLLASLPSVFSQASHNLQKSQDKDTVLTSPLIFTKKKLEEQLLCSCQGYISSFWQALAGKLNFLEDSLNFPVPGKLLQNSAYTCHAMFEHYIPWK